MSITRTSSTSWLQRLKNALIGAAIGLVLLFASPWLLLWNEGRAIETYRALTEGAAAVIPADSAVVNPAYDGKLIHITGPVTVEGAVRDKQYGVSAAGALELSRQVEMYQWVENSQSQTEKKLGGGEETTTTYTYAREWRSRKVDSTDFKEPDGHLNPDRMPENKAFVADGARLGAFQVEGKVLADIAGSSQIELSPQDAAHVAAALRDNRPVKGDGQGLYIGADENAPQVGDLRISYQRADLETASLVGRQQGSSLVAYQTSNHHDILLSAAGSVAPEQMFKSARTENIIITWLLRAAGLVGLFAGFLLLFAIFGVIGDVIPFVGSIISFGTGLVAFGLTLVVGPVFIALGWFAYRPLLAGAVIAGGVVLGALLFLRRRRKVVKA